MNKLTKQQALAKIKELEKYIEEIKEKKPKSIWDIDEDNFEEYWYIDTGGAVSITKDIDWCSNYSEFENDRMNGNAFLTEKGARKELEKRKAIQRVLKWKHKNGLDFEPDWENNNENKYLLFYNYNNYNSCRKKICSNVHFQSKYYCPVGYFKTKKDVEKCIEECKEDLELIYK